MQRGDASALRLLLDRDMLTAIEQLAEHVEVLEGYEDHRYEMASSSLVRQLVQSLVRSRPEYEEFGKELTYGVGRLSVLLRYHPEFRRKILEYLRGDALTGDRFCPECGERLKQGNVGRPRKYCSPRCRKRESGRRLRRNDA